MATHTREHLRRQLRIFRGARLGIGWFQLVGQLREFPRQDNVVDALRQSVGMRPPAIQAPLPRTIRELPRIGCAIAARAGRSTQKVVAVHNVSDI